MRVASTLRVLSLPAAVALGAALAVACSDGAPMGPDPLQPAFKMQGKGGSIATSSTRRGSNVRDP